MNETEKIIDYFVENSEKLSLISENDIKDVLRLCSQVLMSKDGKMLKQKAMFVLLCTAMCPQLDMKKKWAIYWKLHYMLFVDVIYSELKWIERLVYTEIYKQAERELDLGDVPMIEKPDNVVVITTSQFLSEKHAPTRRALDYAYTIQKVIGGYKVVIINDGGLHFCPEDSVCFDPGFSFIPQYSGHFIYKYKGEDFEFYQNPEMMPDYNEMQRMIRLIKSYNPVLVLNVGASCLTSDLCRHFAKTACIPCATELPISMSDYLILCRQFRQNEEEEYKEITGGYQKIINSVFNYVMPQGDLPEYSHDDTTCPEDAWIIASAGNRMGEEITDDFMDMIDKVLDNISNAYYVVIGTVNNSERFTANRRNAERVKFLGNIPSASQLIKYCNLYIQPTRLGGGRAAFEALYYGIPVVTTAYGDTWNVSGDEFAVADYDEMYDRISTLYDDQIEYSRQCELAKAHGMELEDMPAMMRQLLADLEVL